MTVQLASTSGTASRPESEAMKAQAADPAAQEDSDDDYEEPVQPSMIAGSLDEIRWSEHALMPPLITVMRDERTNAAEFRQAVRNATSIVALEATRDLPLRPKLGLKSPVAPFDGFELGVRIALVPIVRAGLEMVDPFLSLLPGASVRHMGISRAKGLHYSKLPAKVDCDLAFVLDPIIATGGTAIAAVSTLQDWGLKLSSIRVITLIASSPGLAKLLAECPGLIVHCGAADETLDRKGQIVPGVGDAGHRLFNT